MYNGIGLSTPRGSGTNGYVVRNLSSLRPQNTKPREQFGSYADAQRSSPAIKQPNQEILLHDRKRQIEVECLKLKMTLEDDGIAEDEIEAKVQQLRESLLSKLESVKAKDVKSLRTHETHQLSEAKQFENKKMMQALRIQETDYVEGAAFDQELQKKLKQERIAKREAEWAERQAQREKDRRNPSPRRSRNTKRDRSPSEPRRSRTPDRKHRRTSEKRQSSASPVKASDRSIERGRSARRSRGYSRSYSRSRSDSRSVSSSRSRSNSRGRSYRRRGRSSSYSSSGGSDSRSRSRSYSRSDRSYSSDSRDSRDRSPPRRR